MPNIKEMIRLILAIIIGMVGSYLLVKGLNVLGITNKPVDDAWGILMGLSTVVIAWVVMKNSTTFKKIESANTRMENKIDKLFDVTKEHSNQDTEQNQRLNTLEEEMKERKTTEKDHSERISKLEASQRN